jgi:hypothetical protein
MVLEGSIMVSTLKHQKKSRNDGSPAADSSLAPYDHISSSIVADGENGDFIDQTVAIWQKHSGRQLNREDGREIIENMTGFFRVLQDWDNAERTAKNARK